MQREKIKTAVALGFFDGVHIGHQRVIQGALEYVDEGFKAVVYTFSGIEKKNRTVNLCLTTNEEKTKLILNLGIKRVYIDDFRDIKNMGCEEFVEGVLKQRLNARHVICGQNYHFGANASGDTEILKKLCKKHEIDAKIIPLYLYKGSPISSTRIRQAIEQGNFKDAQSMLGRKILIQTKSQI